ncbi:60S ribosomal L24 protein [Fusarium subglutinans]|uniref:60S ribosomal L24 protein n=1 Tax=Gibberella subglutinans TaxID=42677 RepID=A0A8H5L1W3_GIBSU|nr:60S ribosomal L24 protein [Fusarium subglutinans]KAF5584820.1 60S ribosomal L24 protein [Fusarium subglutinans]
MRTYEDTFSGARIYPGKGKLYVRGDSKIFRFQNGKSESLFLQRKNPRRIAWTVLYRRQHRKGISEVRIYQLEQHSRWLSLLLEVAKKRTRRTVKAQRGIVGASLDVIKEKRNIRPEARSAARAQAIKESKEKKQADAAAKKSEKAKLAAQASKGQATRQVSKQGAKGSAPKVQAKSR